MVDKHIQLKIHTGNGNFDELFPVTKAELVKVNGKKLSESLNDVTAQLEQTKQEFNDAVSKVTVDSEVVLARGDELVLDDRLNKMDVEIATPDEDVVVSATNLVTNGDFSKGTTGWINDSSTSAVSQNKISITGNGTSAIPQIRKQIQTITIGDKYYFTSKVKVTNSECKFIRTVSLGSTNKQIDFPILNTIYSTSGVTTANTNVYVEFWHSYADETVAIGKVMEVEYVFHLNLTATFGAGNEPTVTQMDSLLTQFPNSWFDGTVNIYNSKHLMGMFFKELTKLNNAVIALGGNV